MAYGNIPTIPLALPGLAAQPSYTIPDIEKRMMQFDDINLWVQPDLGNVRRSGKNLRIAGRKGYQAIASDDAIVVGTGMAQTIETINLPGGNTGSGELPLHVTDYLLGGSYMVSALVRFSASASLSGIAYQIFSAGVDGSDSAMNLYMLNNALYLRHGTTNQNIRLSPLFALNSSYHIMASYDVVADKAELCINSATPLVLNTEALDGPAGGDRELCIGGKFNPQKSAGTQLFHGSIRAAWASNTTHWVGDEKASVREAFVDMVGDLYGNDITIV